MQFVSYLFNSMIPFLTYTLIFSLSFFFCRIVRNKAAEKAKHAHQVATSGGSVTGSASGPVSVIAHAPATQLSEPRTGAYSINGILGLQHDPNGNSIKRKRIDDHGLYFCFIITVNKVIFGELPALKTFV